MDITGTGMIRNDRVNQLLTISDGKGRTALTVNYNGKCVVGEAWVKGRQVLSPAGAYCAVRTADKVWHTTRALAASPTVRVKSNAATISNIRYGGEITLVETWTFTANRDSISWNISRNYQQGGILSDTGFPVWDFADINTWTGALLDHGGVAWMRLLDSDWRTLGTHSGTVTFWDGKSDSCMRIAPSADINVCVANRFTRQADGRLTFCNEAADEKMKSRYNLENFRDNAEDVWKDFHVSAGIISCNYDISSFDYSRVYDIGTLKGLDGAAVREMSNTIARYGVIDSRHAGLNGWMSGYVCLHEPFLGKVAAAVADCDYTDGVKNSYSFYKDHAVLEDGRVLSRFKGTNEDAQPGTYTKDGFYEAQWGTLLDSQPGYVIVVSDIFNLTADTSWAYSQKGTCERVLDYMLARDVDGDGLMEMENSFARDGKSSDWIDVAWAAYKNALVNAEMYGALSLWADIEEVLGDGTRAGTYRAKAEKLKACFNRTLEQGGFWDPENSLYIYWRDADNSVHGQNTVMPVQFAAIGYGVCDDQARINAILNEVEADMRAEKLFSWPLCLTSFAPGEYISDHFPEYENGDIFLGWNELGLRSYVKYDTGLAVQYVKNVIDKYASDGLVAQRYFRESQTATGGDILANNYMTIAGLYSSIYGVQPHYNRLRLEPHITPELNGTVLKYPLRGQQYVIRLFSQNNYGISVNGFTVNDGKAFGVHPDGPDQISYFYGGQKNKSMSLTRSNSALLNMDFTNWRPDSEVWTETSSADITVTHTVSQLLPHSSYILYADGTPTDRLTSDGAGSLSFSCDLKASIRYSFSLKCN